MYLVYLGSLAAKPVTVKTYSEAEVVGDSWVENNPGGLYWIEKEE